MALYLAALITLGLIAIAGIFLSRPRKSHSSSPRTS